MEEKYLTILNVSEYLSVKVSTIYSKIHAIPHYRIGRLIRFKKQDIDAWIETQRETLKSPIRTTRPAKSNTQEVDQIVRKAINSVKGQSSREIKRAA